MGSGPGANSIATQRRSKAVKLQLAKTSQVACKFQSEGFVSVYHSYAKVGLGHWLQVSLNL